MRKHSLSSHWHAMFHALGFGHQKKRRDDRWQEHRTFSFEPLEARQLLSVAPLSDEYSVNGCTANTQTLAEFGHAMAPTPNGGCIVTWTSSGQDGDGTGVYARRLAGTGAPVGSEFRVNTTIVGNQENSGVAVASDGQSVIVWESYGQDGDHAGVYGQRFGTDGQPVGSEFRVNVTTVGYQETPSVACLAEGGFAVVWGGKGAGDVSGVFGRRYDASGSPLEGEFLINTHTENQQELPALAALPDGGFLATWQSDGGQDGDGSGIYAQRFDADGGAVGDEFLVNATTNGQQTCPALAAAADGRFVIAWADSGQDSNGYGVFAQQFDADGVALGGEFQANTYTDGDQVYPSAAYNGRGGFVVAWNGQGSGDPNGVFIREFDADGTALSDQSLVNTTTDDAQRFTKVIAGSSGYVVAWSGRGTGDNDGVFLRRLGSAPTATGFGTQEIEYLGCASTAMDLRPAFEDEEITATNLTYELTSNSNPQLVTSAEIDAATDQLRLTLAIGVSGIAQLTVRATDPGGLFVETAFSMIVSCAEEDPVLYWYPQSNHNWSTSDANWRLNSNGSGNPYAWYNGPYSAVFLNSADTVTVNGTIAYDTIHFATSGYQIVPGTSALLSPNSGLGAITVDSGCSATISPVIGGQNDLVKAGTGTLILTGANTYGGATAIQNGTLAISGGNDRLPTGTALTLGDGITCGVLQLGDGTTSRNQTLAGLVTSGTGTGNRVIGGGSTNATLTLDISGTDTVAAILGAEGTNQNKLNLTKTGSGVLTLCGNNTYTGDTTISEGTIIAADIVVNSGSSNLGNASSPVVLGDASHKGTLSYTGDSDTYARGFTVNAGGGEIDVFDGGQILTVGSSGITGDGSLTVGGAGDMVISSALSSTGGLVKVDDGTLAIAGNNNYSGGI